MAMAVTASPVRRGQWKTITLADGREVRAEARGDEHVVFWQTADGMRYVYDAAAGLYRVADGTALWQEARARRAPMARRMEQRVPGRRTPTVADRYKGRQRGLIVLVEFDDCTFSMPDPKTLYSHVANTPSYSENGFKGSVRDYFLAQSGGAFDLSFDVVGPVKMPHGYAYYGRDNDAKVGEMVHDACRAVADSVDFAAYDWDSDGEAEVVFVLYAGYGQADHSDNDNYIWPHMHALSGYDAYALKPLAIDGTRIDVYACANELDADGAINGIGTFCHEFSHCLGLPDMYDTSEDGINFGMGSWSLMDYGCYSDGGMTPSGYTGYELMATGWTTPTELKGDTAITAMQPLGRHGESFIIYNPAHRNEYYILDNRQPVGFDAALPGRGLLITHVDYNETAWDYNIVNATGYNSDARMNNTHQRATIFHADGDADFQTQYGDAYPYRGNDSLTRASLPSAMLYNANTDGSYSMKGGITHIVQHEDGTMSFRFRAGNAVPDSAQAVSPSGDVLLYESFDRCAGNGGNDGVFRGSVAAAPLAADLDGWQSLNGYGGKQCARFGKSTSSGTGVATTPVFVLTGDTATLTFRAAAWNSATDGRVLLVSVSGAHAAFVDGGDTEVALTMARGAWTDYELRIVGTGRARITFNPSKRFFLDEVKVAKAVPTGIATVARERHGADSAQRVYGIDGRFVGYDLHALPRGVYVVGGKKVVKTW